MFEFNIINIMTDSCLINLIFDKESELTMFNFATSLDEVAMALFPNSTSSLSTVI